MSDNIVRRSLIKETSRNIDNIAKQLDEGAAAEKELITELITKMLDFCNTFVKTTKVEYDFTPCATCEQSCMKDNKAWCDRLNTALEYITPAICNCELLKTKEMKNG